MKGPRAIIHIGGGKLQLRSLRWAKEAGLHVVLTDVNPRCPGRALADRFEKVSGTDVDALLQLARDVRKKYDLAGAYCSNDFGLPAAAAISELFSLPGPTIAAVRDALDKTRARELWERKGLPIPRGWQVQTLEELNDLVACIDLPVIIKPPDSSGSRGVSSARSGTEIKESFQNAKSYSEVVLVEELLIGRHIDVNGLFLDKAFHPCGTLDRFFSDPPYHYPVWGCQPSSLAEAEEKRVYELVQQAARVLGIDDGPVKGDVIFTEKGPVLLEIAPRFHGDVSTAFVTPPATGLNPIRTWFTYLTGMTEIEYPVPGPARTCAGWRAIFPATAGVFGSIQGIDSALALSGVREILVLKQKGSLVELIRDNTSVCGFIFVSGDRAERVDERLRAAEARLKVIFE